MSLINNSIIEHLNNNNLVFLYHAYEKEGQLTIIFDKENLLAYNPLKNYPSLIFITVANFEIDYKIDFIKYIDEKEFGYNVNISKDKIIIRHLNKESEQKLINITGNIEEISERWYPFKSYVDEINQLRENTTRLGNDFNQLADNLRDEILSLIQYEKNINDVELQKKNRIEISVLKRTLFSILDKFFYNIRHKPIDKELGFDYEKSKNKQDF